MLQFIGKSTYDANQDLQLCLTMYKSIKEYGAKFKHEWFGVETEYQLQETLTAKK